MTATINSKSGVCNLALSRLGNFPTVNNIDIPKTPVEITFANVYDTIRQDLLTILMPNFALKRRLVALQTATPAFGWGYQYEYPVDCLRLLGIGEVQDKQNTYAVEGGVIMSNDLYSTGLPIRFIQDIEDVSKMTAQFINTFSQFLGEAVCLALTQDQAKADKLAQLLPFKLASTSATNAQENRPIRISNSRFQAARFTRNPSFNIKA